MESPTLLISGDYSAFAEGFNSAGVYMFSGLYKSQTFSQPIYIGSSIDLKRRIVGEHQNDLRQGEHHNTPLQTSWIKYGENQFVIWCLETCRPCECVALEQNYLNLYRPFVSEFGGFNVSHNSSAPMLGRTHSEETRERIAASHKGIKHSEERKSNIAKGNTGKKLSQDTKDKISQSKEKRVFSIESPDGRKLKQENLSKFCRENSLDKGAISRVLSGKSSVHKGWRLAE